MSQAMSGGGAGQFGDTTFTKVFVGGLAWETHKEGMRAYFEQFGDILEAVVITDKNTGRSKGYGFVTFREPEAALRACIDPYPVIDGRRANCNLAYLGVNKSKIAPVPPYLQPYAHVYGGGNMRAMKSIQTAGGGVASLMSLVPADHGIQQGIPTAAYNVYAGYSPYFSDYGYPLVQLLPSLWWAAGSPTAVCCLWRRRNRRRFNNGSSGQLLPLLPVRSGSWVQHCSVPPVVPVRRSCSGCHDSGTHPDDHRCRRRPPPVRWRGGVYSQFNWPSRHDNVYDSPNSAGPDGAVVPVQQAHSFSPRCGTRSEAQLGLEQPWLTLSFSRLFSTPCMHPPISSSVPTRVSSQTIYAYKS